MTTYSRWQRTIVDGSGNVQAGATVTVYREIDGAIATLKADRDGAGSKSNPFTADSDGFAFFYAAAGRYRIVASSGAFSDDWRDVPLGTAQEADVDGLAGDVYFGAAPAGVRLNFSTTTTASDPGTGTWRANSTTFASITALYIDNADPSGGNITGWLDALDDNGATGHRGILRLVNTDNILAWVEFVVTGSVTNSSGYRTISVTPRAQVGWPFANGGSCAASFAATGAPGSVTGPGSSTDEAIARFDGAGGNLLQNSSVLISDSGDLKTAGYLRVGSTSAPTNTTAGDLTATRLFLSGDAAIASTTASTSTTTGALTVAGGLGVAGALYVGGALSCNAGGTFTTSFTVNRSGGTATVNYNRIDNHGSGVTTGTVRFSGKDSGDTLTTFAEINGYCVTATDTSEAGEIRISTIIAGTFAERWRIGNGIYAPSATGGDKGAGTINLSGDIYKNNSAFTNPDFVFEHFYTGRIERFAKNEGASGYRGLMSLDALRDYTRTHLRLPGIDDEGKGIFARSDIILEKFEELTLYTLDIHERAAKLSDREKALTEEVSALNSRVRYLEDSIKH